MSVSCNLCFNIFKSERGLNYHKKYCGVEKRFECNFCEKELGSNFSLKKHEENCKLKSIALNELRHEYNSLNSKLSSLEPEWHSLKEKVLKYEITIKHLETRCRDLERENKNLLKTLEDTNRSLNTQANTINTLAHKSGNTYNQTNNITNILPPITKEDYDKITSNLLEDHDITNEKLFAKFCMQTGLKNKVIKSDHARKVITYVDEQGKQIKDPKAKELTESIYKSTKTVFEEKAKQYEKFNDDQDRDRLDFYNNIVSVNKSSMEKFSDAIVKEATKNVNAQQFNSLFIKLKEEVVKSTYWLFSQDSFSIGDWIREKIRDKVSFCRTNTSIKKKYITVKESGEKIDNKALKEGLKYSLTIDDIDSLLLEQSLNRPEDKADIKTMIKNCKIQYSLLIESDKEDEWDNVIIGLTG